MLTVKYKFEKIVFKCSRYSVWEWMSRRNGGRLFHTGSVTIIYRNTARRLYGRNQFIRFGLNRILVPWTDSSYSKLIILTTIPPLWVRVIGYWLAYEATRVRMSVTLATFICLTVIGGFYDRLNRWADATVEDFTLGVLR